MALITLEHIDFAYGADMPVVLNGLSLALESGRRIGLVGPSGSGKSSLLKIIVGLLTPTAGALHVLGNPCRAAEDFVQVRRQVGFLFQDADDQLFCPTVLEDVSFGPLNLGRSGEEAEAIARENLAALKLDSLASRITYRLSGGEKRLVALAGVLAMAPRVLLLDEPFTGLDEAAVERLIAVLDGLPQEMIIVSHQKEYLMQLCHDIQDIRALNRQARNPQPNDAQSS